jgi:inositol oxygenase
MSTNFLLTLCSGEQYLYHILKEQSSLPEEGLWMIRYHSFYPYVTFVFPNLPGLCYFSISSFKHLNIYVIHSWHREGAYSHLTAPVDEKALAAVRAFNPYDLYSKSDGGVDVEALKPYYQGLIQKYFPAIIEW